MKIIATFLLALMALMIVLTLTGCTITVSPDGARTYAPHAETIRILAEK